MMTLFMEVNIKNLQLEIIKTGSILLCEQGPTVKQKPPRVCGTRVFELDGKIFLIVLLLMLNNDNPL
jgi:hypothetical protein